MTQMKRTFRKSDGTLVTVTEKDYELIRGLTDEEIERRAASDPDALPFSEEELKEFKRVHPLPPEDEDHGKDR